MRAFIKNPALIAQSGAYTFFRRGDWNRTCGLHFLNFIFKAPTINNKFDIIKT